MEITSPEAPATDRHSGRAIPPDEGQAVRPLLHAEVINRIAQDVVAVQHIMGVPTMLQVLCEVTGMQFAAVIQVIDRRWTLCAVKDDIQFGFRPGSHLDQDTISWMGLRRSRKPILIEQASAESRRRPHHARRLKEVASSVSVPIILGNGRYFGNLCALGLAPVKLPIPIVNMFTHFAALVARHLDSDAAAGEAEVSLRDERASGELREQFIAILGHDLRNPLQAIFATSDLLVRRVKDPVIGGMAARIKANCRRMSSLIDDVFDFSRGRLAEGIGLHLSEIEDLNVGLMSVVDELLDGQPDRRIDYKFSVNRMVRCDLGRMQQVASNLIGNALKHGATDKAVKVTAIADEHDLVFEVWNAGEPIPPDSLAKVFDPFWRRDTSAQREGLGLGLHICAQIMRAHGGELSVKSTREAGTTFTARVPLHSLS